MTVGRGARFVVPLPVRSRFDRAWSQPPTHTRHTTGQTTEAMRVLPVVSTLIREQRRTPSFGYRGSGDGHCPAKSGVLNSAFPASDPHLREAVRVHPLPSEFRRELEKEPTPMGWAPSYSTVITAQISRPQCPLPSRPVRHRPNVSCQQLGSIDRGPRSSPRKRFHNR